MQLLDEAGLMGWYKELPNGLETLVGEKGIKLSAGQKQRLNLIRGILIDKELYFLMSLHQIQMHYLKKK